MPAQDLLTTTFGGFSGSSGGFNIVFVIINIFFWLFLFGIIAGAFFFLWRWLNFNIEVEIWSVKGAEMVYFGEDRARRITDKGTNYIKFLKSKQEEFNHKAFPTSDLLIRKKLFGSKLKVLMRDGEIMFWKPDMNPA